MNVAVPEGGFSSWARLDRATGQIQGSGNLAEALTTTQSMIKSWVVCDYLRDHEPSEADLENATAAIIDSDDDATESLYQAGGGDVMIERMISMCGLTETHGVPGWWSMTTISARDAVRMGLAIADGRAAGPKWTDWVLERMRNVRGSAADADQQETRGGGRWGIIDALPAGEQVAIKNGWTRMGDGLWDVNCLALHKDWVMAVLVGYPAEMPLQVGADLIRDIAAEVLAGRVV